MLSLFASVPEVECRNYYPSATVSTPENVGKNIENSLLLSDFYNSRKFYNDQLISKIIADFVSEFNQKNPGVEEDLKSLPFTVFANSVAGLIILNPTFIGVEVTNDSSLFFVAKFKNAIKVHLEVTYSKDPEINNWTVLNIYGRERERLLSDDGSYLDVYKKLYHLIKKENETYNINLTNAANALSEYTIA